MYFFLLLEAINACFKHSFNFFVDEMRKLQLDCETLWVCNANYNYNYNLYCSLSARGLCIAQLNDNDRVSSRANGFLHTQCVALNFSQSSRVKSAM